MKCERCKHEIGHRIDMDMDDEDWTEPNWEQYLCEQCYNEIWEYGCSQCETHPCERGRECWYNPWPQIMYLCYVGERVIKPNPLTGGYQASVDTQTSGEASDNRTDVMFNHGSGSKNEGGR